MQGDASGTLELQPTAREQIRLQHRQAFGRDQHVDLAEHRQRPKQVMGALPPPGVGRRAFFRRKE